VHTVDDKHHTMLDVAEAAQVSLATVSRALKGDPRISAVVREKVKAAAASLGYTPNPLVQALMTQRRRRLGAHEETLALVTGVPNAVWRTKDVCRWYMEGIEARAQQLGYHIEVISLPELKGDVGRLRRVLVTRGIRGIILGFSTGEEHAAPLDVRDFCVVGLGTYFLPLPVDRVQLHGFFNVKLAFERMRAHGYRKPALIAPARNNTVVGGQWSAAALNDQWQRPPEEQCPPLIVEGDKINMAAFAAWFEQHRPDALLVYKFDIMEVLQRLRISVPEDVGVAYLFGTEVERSKMAGIDGNLDRVGAAAVDLLVQKMHIHERGMPDHPRDVLVTGSWKEGPTLPPRPAQKRSVRRLAKV
jgi:LacI family transcriptional regulator